MKSIITILLMSILLACSSSNGPEKKAPVISAIPDQRIAKDETFSAINLDNYVSDGDNSDSQISWTYGGNSQLTVDITGRIATITKPLSDWVGSESITFKATDPDMLTDQDTVVFTSVDSTTPPVLNSEYFPLDDGDTWYFTSSSLGSIVRVVDGDTVINGRNCIKLLENGVTAQAWSKIETGPSSGFYVNMLSSGSVFYSFDPPLRIPYEMQPDDVYNYTSTVTKKTGGNVETFDISGNLRFEGFVNKTVTAGTFENAIQIYYIEDNYNEFYGRGVGLLDDEDYILDSAFINGSWIR